MENTHNMYYCHIKTDEENIIKGEYNKQVSKFVFYIMKYKGNYKIEFKLPLNMKQFKFDVCLGIDYRNYLVTMKSNDKKYSLFNKMYSVKLNWSTAHCKKSEVFSEENKKYFMTNYDRFDNNKFSEIKRPIRGIIKKSIFNKISTINSFFEELKKKELNFILKVEQDYKNLKEYFEKRIKVSNSCEGKLEIFPLEILSADLTSELFLRIEEIKKFIFKENEEIEKLLSNRFYKKEFSHIIDETFNYEEFEKNSKIQDSDVNPSYLINFYNFNKRNESILKIKNSENILVSMKNKNHSEYFSFKNIPSDKIIKVNKDSEGYMISFDNIIFIFNSTKNSFYFGESNNLEEKEGFGFEGFFNKDNLNLEEEKINFYIGGFKNNLYDGFGALDSDKFFYQGEFAAHKKNGKCLILVKKEKEVYIGEVKENVLQGRGKYLYNSKCEELLSYQGEIYNNHPSGKGQIIYKNFDTFQGEFYEYKQVNTGVYLSKFNDSVTLKFDNDGNEKKEETVYQY